MADTFTKEGGFVPTCQDAFGKLDTATANYGTSV
jgi:hypothetical protein